MSATAITTARTGMPGGRYALNIVHPTSPVLRVRYRGGVLVDPHGFPDWVLYARAVVDLPDPVDGLGIDEMRVVDVLTANMVAAADDSLVATAIGTPAGWCWAHLGRTRRLALVPIELHGAYRHGGGVRTMPVTTNARGLRADAVPTQVRFGPGDDVPDDVLADLERLLGYALPPGYRRYLARSNAAAPVEPAVLPSLGLIVDQPLFGIARTDPHQDLGFVRDYLSDRITPDLLPIGYVQGGLLAVGVSDPIRDSVWYWDDDDPRDDDAYGPREIRSRLLHRCADSFDEFHDTLMRPPERILDVAELWAVTGRARTVRDDIAGAGLPPTMRAPWQAPAGGGRDPVVGLFELT